VLDKKQIVHNTADIPIEDDDKVKEIEVNLKQCFVEEPDGTVSKYHDQIPAVLASFRTLGVVQFTTEITQSFANCPLVYSLQFIDIPALDDNDEIGERPPFSTKAQHYGTVLRAIEKILGPHEFSGGAFANENTVVPFAAIRPFLQSHIVEAEKNIGGKAHGSENVPPPIVAPPKTETTTVPSLPVSVQWSASSGDLEF